MRLVVIANPSSRRIELLKAAARLWPGLTIDIVAWRDLIAGHVDLRQIIRTGDVVRIDSPGKDFEVERMLLCAGAACADDGGRPAAVRSITEERGRVWWPALWYRGFCDVLQRVEGRLSDCPPHRAMNDASEIRAMFDKTATHARLSRFGVPVPPAIGRIGNYDELVSQMQQRDWNQAFVKLAYGSSASGAIALRTGNYGRVDRLQAFTTVELDGHDPNGEPRMYNTRRIRRLHDAREIAGVVNAICRHTAHAERWLPKAGIDGCTFDLRVLVIDGRARHVVVRMSHTPMTNLHLLNTRGEIDRVRNGCGEEAWARAMESCEMAARAFPRSLHAGVDLLIRPDFHRHAVLEVNAFGDLLPGVLWRGMDTYQAELAVMFGQAVPAVAEVA